MKTFHKIICLLILITFNLSVSLHAQEYNIKFHRITIEDGLSQNTVTCILQDNKGLMWFGTQDGLNQFDRTKEIFHHYTMKDGLPNNMIYGILEDTQGNLWLSTNSGISKFNKPVPIGEKEDKCSILH